MFESALLRRLFAIRSVPPHIVALTALASYLSQLFAIVMGWPLWGIVLATLFPWVPILTTQVAWTYRHYQWLALFYILVITQGGHAIEHITQVVQIHLLGLAGAQARGIFGALDIEWVHVSWNAWFFVGVLLLLWRFPRNRWLWLTAAIAGWHAIEHVFIMSTYLRTGVAGTPGLLSRGGALAGGLPLARPDLHLLYNLAMTTPFMLAFVSQLRGAYDEWLAKAFPRLPERVLVETTSRCEVVRFAPGATIVRQGDPSDRLYIVADGAVTVIERTSAGRQVEVRALGPGQYFGEMGMLSGAPRVASVVAKTAVELLALDRDAFRHIVKSSETTGEEIARVALRRLSEQG